VSVPHDKVSGVSQAELVEFLQLTIESSAQAADSFRFNPADSRQLYAILLLYALTDHGRVELNLARAELFTGIGVITRSAIDAYADLCNVCDHPGYFENLEAADASHWKKFLEVASQGRVAALKALSESDLLPVGRRMYAEELRRLTAKGVRVLSIEQRFERAKLKDEYQSLYALLSAEVHNNLSGLRSRYIDRNDDDAWLVRPGMFSRHDHNYGRPCTLNMGEMIVKGTEKVLRLLGHGVAVISGAERELQRIAALAQTEE
jgi:hypothetical protein